MLKSTSEAISSRNGNTQAFRYAVDINKAVFTKKLFSTVPYEWANDCSLEVQNHIIDQAAMNAAHVTQAGSVPSSSYYSGSGYDLLKFIRNRDVHYFHSNAAVDNKLINAEMGTRPRQYLDYFVRRFPSLVVSTFMLVLSLHELDAIPNGEALRKIPFKIDLQTLVKTSDLHVPNANYPPLVYTIETDENDL